jgi:hypothetical protein
MNGILDAVTALVPQYNIIYGTNPPANGFCMLPAGGYQPDAHLDKGQVVRMDCLLNGKGADAGAVNDALWDIHQILTKLTALEYPESNDWQIMDISTIAYPSLIGREDGTMQWIYGSSIEIKFYWKGDDA